MYKLFKTNFIKHWNQLININSSNYVICPAYINTFLTLTITMNPDISMTLIMTMSTKDLL